MLFRAGQKVKKIAYCVDNSKIGIPVGSECTFVQYKFTSKGTISGTGHPYKFDSDCEIAWEGKIFGSRSVCFEPVQNSTGNSKSDTYKVISWDDCLDELREIRDSIRENEHAV